MQRVIVGSADYLAGRVGLEAPETLLDCDWLVLSPVQKNPLRLEHSNTGEVVQIRPTPDLYTNDAQALYRLARAGAGLAVVPEFLAKSDVRSGGIVQLLSDWKMPPIWAFAEWHANAPKHGLIHLALAALSDKA